MPLIPLILLSLPIAEIAAFIVVGGAIGVLPTIGLVLLSAIVGGILLRVQGFGILRRLQREMDDGGDPGRQLAHGAMIVLAGLLLIVPGFVTDVLGLLLFIPPVRDLAWRWLRTRMTVVTPFGFGFPGNRGSGRPARDAKTIDLDADDFSRDKPKGGPRADQASPWRIDRRP